MRKNEKEVLDGYVVDIICLRRISPSQYTNQASEHSTACALMDHCVESGYGLIGENNELKLLDPKATPRIVALLKQTDKDKGVRLRVEREQNDQEMTTTKVSFA
ncbi:hypothetical protein JRG66_02505 [Salinimicrobium tongyeongense]|jgi:hypothetical protein|uniref:Uncharacterized protein n=1 Tax=Salinimicrobium tongyeongense TaxID=2809707 RepID=A0ABY6NS87_9FLAO|nr:hypothetical protein [Salinimicrobium tongyeongense]UZH55776.1 hypothetical protein JRG66_02505 [Salinimicrobium tongyeongense]